MHKFKGIIFDLDGTLVNSLEDLIDSCNVIMKDNQFPTHSYEAGKKLIGRGIRNLTRDAMPEKYRDDESFVDQLTEMLKSEYETCCTQKTKPYQGITAVLDYLKEKNIPFGVSTNKPDGLAKAVVHQLFTAYDFVDVVGYTTDELRKPNPTKTLAIAEKMGVKPENCLFVGDSKVDYETAIAGGMLPVICTWGFESLEVIATFQNAISIDKPQQIIDALRYGKEMGVSV